MIRIAIIPLLFFSLRYVNKGSVSSDDTIDSGECDASRDQDTGIGRERGGKLPTFRESTILALYGVLEHKQLAC